MLWLPVQPACKIGSRSSDKQRQCLGIVMLAWRMGLSESSGHGDYGGNSVCGAAGRSGCKQCANITAGKAAQRRHQPGKHHKTRRCAVPRSVVVSNLKEPREVKTER